MIKTIHTLGRKESLPFLTVPKQVHRTRPMLFKTVTFIVAVFFFFGCERPMQFSSCGVENTCGVCYLLVHPKDELGIYCPGPPLPTEEEREKYSRP